MLNLFSYEKFDIMTMRIRYNVNTALVLLFENSGPRYNFVPGPANSLGSHGRTEAGGKH